jgi:tetratricopeptide (TPR) repeat protein
MEAMVFICMVCIWSLGWQVSRIQKTVDQILENQNAGDENQNADNAYSTCRARARKHLGRGQLSEAVLDLTEAIRLKPDHAEAYNQRGLVYRRLEKYAEAIEDYTEAIRIVPDFRDAYVNRGTAYEKQGDQAKADADDARAKELA